MLLVALVAARYAGFDEIFFLLEIISQIAFADAKGIGDIPQGNPVKPFLIE